MRHWPCEGSCDNGTKPYLPDKLNFAIFAFPEDLVWKDIDSMSITLSIEDGDTALGEFDHNNITLGLDGIDTGVALNGFAGGQLLEQTFTFTPSSEIMQSLVNALNEDGMLFASLLDATPGDNLLNLSGYTITSLSITGCADTVPEPLSLLVWGLAICLFIGRWHRRTPPMALARIPVDGRR